MQLRRFTGATTADAVRKVKEALGERALVLATRQTAEGEVEITAAVDLDEGPTEVGAEAPRDAARLASASGASPARDARSIGPTSARALLADADLGCELDDPVGIALVYRHVKRLGARLAAIDRRLQGGADAAELGAAGREIALALESSGLARRIAGPVAARFERELAGGRRYAEALAASLAEHLPIARRERGARDARVAVFVGPSGGGKTTAIAKLAAAAQTAGPAAAIVSTDTHRLGAAEQLEAYARLLGVPFRRVEEASALRGALAELGDRTAVLIDTAGCATEGERLDAIAALVAGAGEPVDVTAVVSATTSARALDRAWDALGRLAPTSCVMTKLDECDDPGEVCTWIADTGMPLEWLGTGPEVSAALVAASGASLVRWLVAA